MYFHAGGVKTEKNVRHPIYVCLHQPMYHRELVLCYRTVRHSKDFKGGYNHYLARSDLKKWSYSQLLETLSELRKDGCTYERAA